ncbi:ketopantoate reductase family protein [Chloroflexota bacterium]
MKVVVIGAGAVGGVIGGHLLLANQNVVWIDPSESHVKAINEHGLRLITPSATHILRPLIVTSPDQVDFEPDDVVFLCVKGHNTEAALRSLQAVIKDIPILCFQNAVRNEEIASQYFPRVYGVLVRVTGMHLTDGEVVSREEPPGGLMIGCYPQGTDELAEQVAEKLRTAGFPVIVRPNVMDYKWGKLISSIGNPIGAIASGRGEDFDIVSEAVKQEFRDLTAKAGIRWIPGEELQVEWPEADLPGRATVDMKTGSSSWQSLARREGAIESEFFNGEVVRLAKKLELKAPVNEGIVRISQEMAAKQEPPGKYAPAELRKMLGL